MAVRFVDILFPDIPILETWLASTKEPGVSTVKPLMLVPDPPSNIVNTGMLNRFFIAVPDLLHHQ